MTQAVGSSHEDLLSFWARPGNCATIVLLAAEFACRAVGGVRGTLARTQTFQASLVFFAHSGASARLDRGDKRMRGISSFAS